MKTRLWLWLIVGGPLTCMAADPVPSNATPVSWINPADPAVKEIRQIGERQIDRIGQLLVFEVDRMVKEQGLAKTMELVHLKGVKLLPAPVAGQPRVTAIKRTSLDLRDPANRPDAADKAALDLINTALTEGDEIPSILVQRIDSPGAPAEWRVYRPISTMPLCLKCHGPVDTLSPEVKAFLAQKYPEDRAVGYTANKWRGIIRVSLAAPDAAGGAPSK